jgi:amino acid adenylation domain-containing protein
VNSSQRRLWTGFVRSAEKFPERTAIIAEGKALSYRELHEFASRIAATIQAHTGSSIAPLTAVFAYRSPVAFAGVLGALLAGNGYVPLNRTFPVSRTRLMLERSQCTSVIVDAGSLPQLNDLLDGAQNSLLVIIPDLRDTGAYRERWHRHTFVGSEDLKPSETWRAPAVQEDAIAYLLFTSGSTGTPKAVMVPCRSVTSFVDYMVERFQITEHDIVSQMFDLTFDVSVFDMFVSWERGACVCCPSHNTLINPEKFIQNHRLTIWFSVPSTVILMKKLGLVKPNKYPSLRLSLFAGEPLPISVASSWLEAAPNSRVENLYGPTELTVACTCYRWDPESSPGESELGIVPIGYPCSGMNVLVVDDNLTEVGPGDKGELLMNGPQMSLGYWNDPEKTASAFIVPPSQEEIFYRTGDRVRRPLGNGPLTHLGRTDVQIKVLGRRVELLEVEAVVRQISGSDGVLAVGWPKTATGYGGIEVFIEGESRDVERLRNSVASQLPDFMVPRRVHFMGKLPRNANNKLDRTAILEVLGEGL